MVSKSVCNVPVFYFDLGEFCFSVNSEKEGSIPQCGKTCYKNCSLNGKKATFKDFKTVASQVPGYSSIVLDGGMVTAVPWFNHALCFCKNKMIGVNYLLNYQEFYYSYYYFKERLRVKNEKTKEGFGYQGVAWAFLGEKALLSYLKIQHSSIISTMGLVADLERCYFSFVLGKDDVSVIWKFRGLPIYVMGYRHTGNAAKLPFPEKKVKESVEWLKKTHKFFYQLTFDDVAVEQMGLKPPINSRKTYYVNLVDHYVAKNRDSIDRYDFRETPLPEILEKIELSS